jgi:hypothetical protein
MDRVGVFLLDQVFNGFITDLSQNGSWATGLFDHGPRLLTFSRCDTHSKPFRVHPRLVFAPCSRMVQMECKNNTWRRVGSENSQVNLVLFSWNEKIF